jgi:hypothetical protein
MINTFFKVKENQYTVVVFIALLLALAYMVSTASAMPASAPNGQDFFSYTPVFGSMTIYKQTIPNGDPTGFQFTGDVSATLSDDQSIFVSKVSGTYTVTEILPDGWGLIDITCDDANSSGDITTQTATIIIDFDEDINCTFTNKKFVDTYLPMIIKK